MIKLFKLKHKHYKFLKISMHFNLTHLIQYHILKKVSAQHYFIRCIRAVNDEILLSNTSNVMAALQLNSVLCDKKINSIDL